MLFQIKFILNIAVPTNTITGPVGKSNIADTINPNITINSPTIIEKIINFLNDGAITLAEAGGSINKALTKTMPKILMPNTTARANIT